MVCRMDWIREIKTAEMVISRQQAWSGEMALLVKRLLHKQEVLPPSSLYKKTRCCGGCV